jgi:hypothetical protein
MSRKTMNLGRTFRSETRKVGSYMNREDTSEEKNNRNIFNNLANKIYLGDNSDIPYIPKIPIAMTDGDIYSIETINIYKDDNTSSVDLFLLTDLGKQEGFSYNKRNYEVIRSKLISKLILPPSHKTDDVNQYKQDVSIIKNLQGKYGDQLYLPNLPNPISGGRKKTKKNKHRKIKTIKHKKKKHQKLKRK